MCKCNFQLAECSIGCIFGVISDSAFWYNDHKTPSFRFRNRRSMLLHIDDLQVFCRSDTRYPADTFAGVQAEQLVWIHPHCRYRNHLSRNSRCHGQLKRFWLRVRSYHTHTFMQGWLSFIVCALGGDAYSVLDAEWFTLTKGYVTAQVTQPYLQTIKLLYEYPS